MRGRSILLKVVRDHRRFPHGSVVEVASHAPIGEARIHHFTALRGLLLQHAEHLIGMIDSGQTDSWSSCG